MVYWAVDPKIFTGRTWLLLQSMNHEKTLSMGPAKGRQSASGTTVLVQDLFYRMPVRRRSISEGLVFEQIRHRVAAYALANPNVSYVISP